jgi:hypothetical protein
MCSCLYFVRLQLTTDVVALLDEWAARFFEELDYVKEGQNATIFAAQMARDLPQVCAGLGGRSRRTCTRQMHCHIVGQR